MPVRAPSLFRFAVPPLLQTTIGLPSSVASLSLPVEGSHVVGQCAATLGYVSSPPGQHLSLFATRMTSAGVSVHTLY